MRRVIGIICLIVLLLVPGYAQNAQTPDSVMINSKNWQDVYSGVLYGKLSGIPHNFLVSERHALIYYQTLDTNLPDILLLESDQQYYSGFEEGLEDLGFSVERVEEQNMNLALARRLVDERNIRSFILLDDAYGYNAISAAPYAVLSKSYVLFVNEQTIEDIVDFLSEVQPVNLLQVGFLNREIQTSLEGFSMEVIDAGGRFDNNVALVKKFREINPVQQIIITNGEFIEDEIMTGLEPVVFIGKENIPDVTKQYVTSSDIQVAVLIGNDLVQTGTLIKRELNITTFIKFARTARIPTGLSSQIEGLDLFYLPKYDLSMDIASARYNELTQELEVTYENTANLALYFRSSLTVDDGITNTTLGDREPIFMDRNERRTVVYKYNTAARAISVKALVVYGETPSSMEKAVEKTLEAELVRILDSTTMEIVSIFYTKKDKAFGILVKNTGTTDGYVSGEIIDALIDLQKTTLGSERVISISANEEKTVYVRAELTDLDLEDNPLITGKILYGQREDALIKNDQKRLALEIKGFEYLPYVIGAAVLVLIIFFLLLRRKKKHYHHH